MTYLKEITIEELKPYITLAFEGDAELLDTYHISNGSLEHCVDHTYSFLYENSKDAVYKKDIKFYAVIYNGSPVGFTVVVFNDNIQPMFKNELSSFGINIKMRKSCVLREWLGAVRKKLSDYYVVLWSKNERAIRFFEMNNFSVYRETAYLNDKTKTLITTKA